MPKARVAGPILALIGARDMVELDSVLLDRAAQPMPTELETLDVIHLATAHLWKELTPSEGGRSPPPSQ